MSAEHRNTEAGYCETWDDPRSKDVDRIQWPDHPWAGDEYGHNCTGCQPDSPWKCDKVAHNLGQVAREQPSG